MGHYIHFTMTMGYLILKYYIEKDHTIFFLNHSRVKYNLVILFCFIQFFEFSRYACRFNLNTIYLKKLQAI
jgi:hypothetical protein